MNLIESVPNPMSNSKSFLAAGVVTMSSREIAEYVATTHDSVLKTIRALIEKGVVSGNETPYTHPQNKQTYTEFLLDYRNTMVVVSGYSVEIRARIIDRWQELEAQVAKPVQAELSRMDILQIAMQAEQERLVAIEQRDEAIRTKAEIGSRREATAMATAAKAKREAYMLKEKLGFNANHATVITVEKALKRKFPANAYVGLRKWCKANGATAKDVTDPRYGKVKAWPAAAWLEVYGVDLVEVNGEAV